MTLTYKKLAFNGVVRSVLRSDGISFLVPLPGEAEAPYLQNAEYAQFKADGGIAADPDPPPPIYTTGRPLTEQRARTTNATPVEIFRAAVPQNTAYKALLTIWGITDDLAHFRLIEAIVVVGRAGGDVVIVQTRVSPANATIMADHAVGTGGAWALPTVAVDNTAPGGVQRHDVVISVTGPASPAVNWLLTGSFETFTPGGA